MGQDQDQRVKLHVDLDLEETAQRLTKMAMLVSTIESRLESIEKRVKGAHQAVAELETKPSRRARQ